MRSVENGGLARLRLAEAKRILASFVFEEFNIYSYNVLCLSGEGQEIGELGNQEILCRIIEQIYSSTVPIRYISKKSD